MLQQGGDNFEKSRKFCKHNANIVVSINRMWRRYYQQHR